MAASISFAVPATFFKENSRSSESTDPLFIGEAFEFTADDGTKFYIQEIDPKYREQKPCYTPYGEINPRITLWTPDLNWEHKMLGAKYMQDFVPYAILCEDKDQILYLFELHKDFFKRDDAKYELKISKNKEYENITTYSFDLKYTFLDYKDDLELGGELVITSEFWADKKHNKYCGSLEYPPFPLMPKYFNEPVEEGWSISSGYIVLIDINRDELSEYYFCVADYYLEVSDGYIDEAHQKLANDEIFPIVDYREYDIRALMYLFDYETGLKKAEEVGVLYNKASVIRKRKNTVSYLTYLTQYTDATVAYFEKRLLNEYDPPSAEQQQAMKNKPEFESQLPRTEEELKEYLAWMQALYRFYTDKLYDDYGTEIKFELIPGGLKATSAGLDRIFGNEDDIVFVREFK